MKDNLDFLQSMAASSEERPSLIKYAHQAGFASDGELPGGFAADGSTAAAMARDLTREYYASQKLPPSPEREFN